MIESSSADGFSVESRRWWECDVKYCCEWTQEGGLKVSFRILVVTDGYRCRYNANRMIVRVKVGIFIPIWVVPQDLCLVP